MAYRQDTRCHLCPSDEGVGACSTCNRGVCPQHLVASYVDTCFDFLGQPPADPICIGCALEPLIARAQPVAILHTTDPLEAQGITEMLQEAGVAAGRFGTSNAALLGAGPQILQQRVEVAADDLVAALDTLRAYRSAGDADDGFGEQANGGLVDTAHEQRDDVQAPAGSDSYARGKLGPRQPLLAAGAAFVFPGGANYHARAYHSGGLFTAAFIVWMAVAIAVSWVPGWVGMVGVVLGDSLTGQWAAAAHNAGKPLSTAAQIGRTVLSLLCIASAALLAAI